MGKVNDPNRDVLSRFLESIRDSARQPAAVPLIRILNRIARSKRKICKVGLAIDLLDQASRSGSAIWAEIRSSGKIQQRGMCAGFYRRAVNQFRKSKHMSLCPNPNLIFSNFVADLSEHAAVFRTELLKLASNSGCSKHPQFRCKAA